MVEVVWVGETFHEFLWDGDRAGVSCQLSKSIRLFDTGKAEMVQD